MANIFPSITPDYTDESTDLKVWKFNTIWEAIGGYNQELNDKGNLITTNQLACNYGDLNSIDYWKIDDNGNITATPAKHSVDYASVFFATRGENRYSSAPNNIEGLINADLELHSNFGYNNNFQMNLQLRESTNLPTKILTDISSFFQYKNLTRLTFMCNGSYFSNVSSTIYPGELEKYKNITDVWGAYYEYDNPVTWGTGLRTNYLFMTYDTGDPVANPSRMISSAFYCRPIFYSEGERFYYYIDPIANVPEYYMSFSRANLLVNSVGVNYTYNFMYGILPDSIQFSEFLFTQFFGSLTENLAYLLYYIPLKNGTYKTVTIKNKSGNVNAFYDIDSNIVTGLDNKKPGFVISYRYNGENGYVTIKPMYNLYALISLLLSSGCLYQTVTYSNNSPITSGGTSLIDGENVFYSLFIQTKTDVNGINTGYDWINLYKDFDQYEEIDDVGKIDINPPGSVESEDTGNTRTGSSIALRAPTNLSGCAGFVTNYCLTNDQMRVFGSALWASFTDSAFWQSLAAVITDSLSINPADILNYIISLRCYPIDLISSGISTTDKFYIGRGTSGIDLGSTLSYNTDMTIFKSCGSILIPEYNNSYLDYAPYRTVSIYLPFCGEFELNATDVSGSELTVHYAVDLTTGICTAFVLSSYQGVEYPVMTVSGQMGQDVQLTAGNLAPVAYSLANAVVSGFVGEVTGGVAGGIAGLKTGNKFLTMASSGIGAVSGGLTGFSKNIESGLRPTHCNPGASFNAFYAPMIPYVIIKSSRIQKPGNFGQTQGNITLRSRFISEMTGFIQVINPDCSGIPATESELTQIRTLLENGIHV